MVGYVVGRGFDALNWTVFRAATLQPSDCIVNTAILLPTLLAVLLVGLLVECSQEISDSPGDNLAT